MNLQILPRMMGERVAMRAVKGLFVYLWWNVIIHVTIKLTRSNKSVLLP